MIKFISCENKGRCEAFSTEMIDYLNTFDPQSPNAIRGWVYTKEISKWEAREIILIDNEVDENEKVFFYRNIKFGRISDAIGLPYKYSENRVAKLNTVYLHFPNSNDFLLLGSDSQNLSTMQRYRLNNPFKSLVTSSSL